MARFDVHANPGQSAEFAPFLVILQDSAHDDLTTVVVAPLVYADRFRERGRLTPHLGFGDQQLVLAVPELAAIYRRQLGVRIGNVSNRRDEIIAALDLLFTGI